MNTKFCFTVVAVSLFLVAVHAEKSTLNGYFKHVDSNQDGVISLPEWVVAVIHMDSDDGPVQVDLNKVNVEYYRSVFSIYDLNGDGVQDWAEWEKSFSRMARDKTSPEQVRLALGDESSGTTMTVIWVTKYDAGVNGTIVQYQPGNCPQNTTTLAYSTTGISYTYEAGVLGWDGYVHKVKLTGLTPGQLYCYTVGGQNGPWSELFWFKTRVISPNPIPPTSIAVFGDMGTVMPEGFRVTEFMVNNSLGAGKPFDVAVHAGDIAYAGTGGKLEWESIWDLWGNQVEPLAAYTPYMTAVGNHEKYYNFTSYKARFDMPAQSPGSVSNFYSSFDYGYVHFTLMCTEDYVYSYSPGSPQYAWLQQDLIKANANRKNVPFLVVVGHRPMYSSDASTDSGDLQQMVEPLLHQYGVDIAVWGHMHEYERTYPVWNNTVGQYPPVGQNPPVFQSPTDTIHLTIGTAGAFIGEHWVQPPPVWSAHRAQHYGYGNFLVHNNTHLEFNMYSDHERANFDSFWLVKQ